MKVRYGNELVDFRLSHLLEFGLLHLVAFIFRLFPLRWELKWSEAIGAMLFRLDRKHRERAIDNLTASLPACSGDEVRKTARSVFVNLVRIAFEFLHIRKLSSREFIDRNVRLVNWDMLDNLLKQGRGVIVITSHLGNWELEGAVTCTLGYPLNAIYYQQSNFMADRFFNSVREKAGIKLIYKRNAFRNILRALERNELVAFLSDQDARKDGVFVDFFGRPASTAKGPVYFSLKTGAPVILAWFVRDDNGYTFCLEEIPIERTGDMDADLSSNTRRWTARLEAVIRRYPEQWFWVHRRWKSKPPPDGTAGP